MFSLKSYIISRNKYQTKVKIYKIVCYVQQRNKLKIKNVGNKLMNDK